MNLQEQVRDLDHQRLTRWTEDGICSGRRSDTLYAEPRGMGTQIGRRMKPGMGEVKLAIIYDPYPAVQHRYSRIRR